MDMTKILTTDYKLPPFSAYWKKIVIALFFVLLPNVLMQAIAWRIGASRPLLNLDYFLALFIFVLPFRLAKWLGGAVLTATISIEILTFMLQMFPFMDMSALQYFAPFILFAPTRYLVLIAGAVIYTIGMPFLMAKISTKVSMGWFLFWAVILGIFSYLTWEAKYKEAGHEQWFGLTNDYFTQSQVSLFYGHYASGFVQDTKKDPVLFKGQDIYAALQLKQPYSDRILFVVAESLGALKTEAARRDLLKEIYARENKFEFIETGRFEFVGATVMGELRELCHLNVKGGYALHKTPAENFSGCLPNKLNNAGYMTIAMHGASSELYDRRFWYEKAGFQKKLFAENFLDRKHCTAFNGACDSELFADVKKAFAENPKLFFYWLTLTSHSSYPESDITNHRLDCAKHELAEGDICNNVRLQVQFFDDLAKLLEQPEMKGVEVIVVGDHMPPIMGDVPLYKAMHWQEVGWLHLKVKS